MIKQKNTLINLAIISILIVGSLSAQAVSFSKEALISTPGQNTDAVVGIFFDYSFDSYLAWVNIQGGIYSIYLMQIGYELHEPDLVYQSDLRITNLAVSWEGYVYYDQFDGEYWSQYAIDETSIPILQQDSLNIPSEPAIHGEWLVWIEDGNLLFKDTGDSTMDPIVADTFDCRSPSIFYQGYGQNWEVVIIYEAGPTENTQIKYLTFSNADEVPQIQVLSSEYPSRNPTLGSYGGCSYEIFLENDWHVVKNVDPLGSVSADTTTNVGYNLSSPALYLGHWLVGREISQDFMVAVSDSLEHDLDIYFLPGWYGNHLNISEMPGADTSPLVTITWGDSITVIWEHTTDTGSELWWAKDRMDAGAIDPVPELPQTIAINRVYPSPFNPSTTLEYSLFEPGIVQLSIYDIAGRQVYSRTFQHTEPGNKTVSWNGSYTSGSPLQSGIYMMELKAGQHAAVRKVVLLR